MVAAQNDDLLHWFRKWCAGDRFFFLEPQKERLVLLRRQPWSNPWHTCLPRTYHVMEGVHEAVHTELKGTNPA